MGRVFCRISPTGLPIIEVEGAPIISLHLYRTMVHAAIYAGFGVIHRYFGPGSTFLTVFLANIARTLCRAKKFRKDSRPYLSEIRRNVKSFSPKENPISYEFLFVMPQQFYFAVLSIVHFVINGGIA